MARRELAGEGALSAVRMLAMRDDSNFTRAVRAALDPLLVPHGFSPGQETALAGGLAALFALVG